LLLVYATLQTAGHNPGDRFVTVADKHLFAVLYELDVSAELRL
jgi:hypothetical protein